MTLNFQSQDGATRISDGGSQNGRGPSRSFWRRRSAACTLPDCPPARSPRTQGDPSCRGAAKRAEARTHHPLRDARGWPLAARVFAAGQNCTGVKWRKGAGKVQERCSFPGSLIGWGDPGNQNWFTEGNKENEAAGRLRQVAGRVFGAPGMARLVRKKRTSMSRTMLGAPLFYPWFFRHCGRADQPPSPQKKSVDSSVPEPLSQDLPAMKTGFAVIPTRFCFNLLPRSSVI